MTKNVLISGSSGLLGGALVARLEKSGCNITRLVRTASPPTNENLIRWDPLSRSIDPKRLEGFDAVVHLAGESIAEGRWTAAKKKRIRDSRVESTVFLADTLARLPEPPKIFVSASAIGFYGDRGEETVSESSSPGSSFLATVCAEWENAAEPLLKRGRRVAHLRTGIVISADGGALAKMLLPFKLGLGGKIGSGEQWMSWIDVDDWVGAVEHILKTESLSGPVNLVAPQPVKNAEFTKTLGRVLSRPTIFPLPGFAARLLLGEMADELLLSGARVEPARLVKSGYSFRYAGLESSLRHALQRGR